MGFPTGIGVIVIALDAYAIFRATSENQARGSPAAKPLGKALGRIELCAKSHYSFFDAESCVHHPRRQRRLA